MIYLDHNATTPLDPRVRAKLFEVLGDEDGFGNPSSVHVRGQRARAVVERARRAVAAALAARPREVLFTAGGTESDNLAIMGAIRASRAKGRRATVVTSPLEHPAVLGAVRQLAREGHRVAYVPVDRAGRITAEALGEVLEREQNVGLVSLAAANHELGNAYDIPALVAVTRHQAPDALFHCDAVQAFGKIALDVSDLDVDLLSVSAHKIHGPRGVGALVRREGVEIEPLMFGGPQERGRRPGTESPVLLAGFGVAATFARREQRSRFSHCEPLRRRLLAGLRAVPGAVVFGEPQQTTGNTVLVGFDGCDGQLVMINLDVLGFAVSTGAACASGTMEPSPVLLALGCSPAESRSAIRISVGKDTREHEVDALLEALPGVIDRVRGAS